MEEAVAGPVLKTATHGGVVLGAIPSAAQVMKLISTSLLFAGRAGRVAEEG
jgi:hypothetical protein